MRACPLIKVDWGSQVLLIRKELSLVGKANKRLVEESLLGVEVTRAAISLKAYNFTSYSCGFKYQKCIVFQSWSLNSKTNIPAGLVSSEASLLGLQMAAFFLPLLLIIPWCKHICPCHYTTYIGIGPNLKGLILT